MEIVQNIDRNNSECYLVTASLDIWVKPFLEKLNLPADNQIRILDLKLLDKNNEVVDSKANRTVAIVLKEDEKDVAVYHIKENGDLELMRSKIKDGKVIFEIDHFSKFAIVSNTLLSFDLSLSLVRNSSTTTTSNSRLSPISWNQSAKPLIP